MNSDDNLRVKVSVFIVAMITLVLTAATVGVTDPAGASKTLLDAGYSDIRTGGYGLFACSTNDWFSTKFTAKGPTGRPVSGVVCRGMLKNSTVRLD